MHIFSEVLTIELLDGAVVSLFAAAATCRARVTGGNLAGAVILGCVSALLAPVFREVLLHGQAGVKLVINALPAQAFIGACASLVALRMAGNKQHLLFFWLDSLGICLGASLFAALALPELGLVGALVLSLANALLPGLIRDLALGDVAMFVDKNWYAASVALAAIAALTIIVVWHIIPVPEIWSDRPGEVGTAGGCIVGVVFRYWKGRDF